jgi:hypothetical protein
MDTDESKEGTYDAVGMEGGGLVEARDGWGVPRVEALGLGLGLCKIGSADGLSNTRLSAPESVSSGADSGNLTPIPGPSQHDGDEFSDQATRVPGICWVTTTTMRMALGHALGR